jgi:hypothetical protein
VGRLLALFLIGITVLLGASYASAFLFGIMGPFSIAILQDGTPVTMELDANLPRPEWVPVYPGATVVQAARLTSVTMPSGFHSLDLATGGSLEEVRRFYVEHLQAAGFDVEDQGLGPLNPPTAAYLGIAGMLSAHRTDTDDEFNLMIRTPDGFFGGRLIQSQWRKTRERPTLEPPPRS